MEGRKYLNLLGNKGKTQRLNFFFSRVSQSLLKSTLDLLQKERKIWSPLVSSLAVPLGDKSLKRYWPKKVQ